MVEQMRDQLSGHIDTNRGDLQNCPSPEHPQWDQQSATKIPIWKVSFNPNHLVRSPVKCICFQKTCDTGQMAEVAEMLFYIKFLQKLYPETAALLSHLLSRYKTASSMVTIMSKVHMVHLKYS